MFHESATSLIVPGSCPRLGGRRPPRHVDRRTQLTKQRCNACADASACTRHNQFVTDPKFPVTGPMPPQPVLRLECDPRGHDVNA